jgi:hypothetical protein
MKDCAFADMDKDTTQLELYKHFISFFLPEGLLDFFDLVWVESQSLIHLDERDNRTEDMQELRPNGFTEPTILTDFPIRERRVELHIRRRRWLTPDGKNVILNMYPLVASGTRYSAEFAAFFCLFTTQIFPIFGGSPPGEGGGIVNQKC